MGFVYADPVPDVPPGSHPQNVGRAQQVNQYAQALTGQADVGALALAGPTAAPGDEVLAGNGDTSGGMADVTAYRYVPYYITGVADGSGDPANYAITGRTMMGPEGAHNVVSLPPGIHSVTLAGSAMSGATSTLESGAAATVIGWGVARTNVNVGGTFYAVPGCEVFIGTLGGWPADSAATDLASTAQVQNSNWVHGPQTGTNGQAGAKTIQMQGTAVAGQVVGIGVDSSHQPLKNFETAVVASVAGSGPPPFIWTLTQPLRHNHLPANSTGAESYSSDVTYWPNTTGTCLTVKCGFDPGPNAATGAGQAWSVDVPWRFPFTSAPGGVALTPDGGSPSNCTASVADITTEGFVLVLTSAGAGALHWHGVATATA